jgi:hypothetical protein
LKNMLDNKNEENSYIKDEIRGTTLFLLNWVYSIQLLMVAVLMKK